MSDSGRSEVDAERFLIALLYAVDKDILKEDVRNFGIIGSGCNVGRRNAAVLGGDVNILKADTRNVAGHIVVRPHGVDGENGK